MNRCPTNTAKEILVSFTAQGSRLARTHLVELSQHEVAGNLDRVDLQCWATLIDAAVRGAGSDAQHDRLRGAQQLVVHLMTRTRTTICRTLPTTTHVVAYSE